MHSDSLERFTEKKMVDGFAGATDQDLVDLTVVSVVPEKQKVQRALKALFGGNPGVAAQGLEKGRGRPSVVSKAVD